MSKDHLYVTGDTGTNRLLFGSEARELAAGAELVFEILQALLADDYSVIPTIQGTGNSKLKLPLLDSRDIELKSYLGTLRITGYKESSNIAVQSDSCIAATHTKFLRSDIAIGKAPTDLLVMHYAGLKWEKECVDECTKWIRDVTTSASSRPRADLFEYPRVIVNLSTKLPQLLPQLSEKDRKALKVGGSIIAATPERPFKSDIWNTLYSQREHVGIVTSMTTLRGGGAIIGRRLSFENTVEDFCAEMHRFPILRLLSDFGHLFVRIGMVGVVHIRQVPDTTSHDRFNGELYFAPYAREWIHRAEEDEGSTIGRNALLIAALAHYLKLVPKDPSEDKSIWKRVCKYAIGAMQAMDDHGYNYSQASTGLDVILNSIRSVKDTLSHLWKHNDDAGFCRPPLKQLSSLFGFRQIPSRLFAPLPSKVVNIGESWRILDDVLMEAPVHRINIALSIVMAGHENVLNRCWGRDVEKYDAFDGKIWSWLTRKEFWNPQDRAPDFITLQEGYMPILPPSREHRPLSIKILGDIEEPFWLDVPVMKLGALNLVERDEIENIRSIANLMRLHRKHVERPSSPLVKAKPISIAVFGAPGTGKSFAVKQLSRMIGDEKTIPHMEFNVSQFSDPQDLAAALLEVKKKTDQRDMTPLVFFDEFDCPLDGVELGWLKHFLAPMQDGRLRDGMTEIGPAFFVFAGGIFPSFNRFDPRTDATYDNLRDSEQYQQRLTQFRINKGPDFISRLRGHLDILPINDHAGHPKHFIRRAILLRSFLEKNGRIGQECRAQIDEAVVYAFLTVDHFCHGVRSMEAIVDMCTPIHGKIEIASLPPRAQLAMHVDATEFMIRVHRGRVRSQIEWQSAPGPEGQT